MKKLLNNSYESFYWLGFLLADGYFNFDKNSISVTVSEIDEQHLEIYNKFLELNRPLYKYTASSNKIKDGKYVRVSVANKTYFPQITAKLNLTKLKTYNPPNFHILNFSQDDLFSLIMGLFDGDGNIHDHPGSKCSGSKTGRLVAHSSWISNLIFIQKYLNVYFALTSKNKGPTLDKNGLAKLNFNGTLLRCMKNKAKELNLPYMKRKWAKVDNHVNTWNKSQTESSKKAWLNCDIIYDIHQMNEKLGSWRINNIIATKLGFKLNSNTIESIVTRIKTKKLESL